MQRFDQLPLSPSTLNAVAALGYETPTPVQAQAIAPMLQGQDLIAQARTGTGKTAAFGIPLVEAHLKARQARGVVALVLVPTRELAIQVAESITDLSKGSGLRVVTVYGGVGFNPQVEALRQPGAIALVATPGRLLDHLQQRTVRLDGVRTLILDEADRMLDMGFLPDVERVLRALPRERQTALFSATVPEPIKQLAKRFMRPDAAHVRVEAGPAATPLAEQFRIDVQKADKPRALAALLDREGPERAIVFTRTKHLARRLAQQLAKQGWEAVALQGNMSQSQRERAMGAFREGRAKVLVATDIASRGIDVVEISHVVNYDIPHEPDAYVHRIGRTARMGRTGRAFTFVQPDQAGELRDVERAAGARLQPFDVGPLPDHVPDGPAKPPQPFHAPFSARPAQRVHERRDATPHGPADPGPYAPRREQHRGPPRTHAPREGPPARGNRSQGWRQRHRADGSYRPAPTREQRHQGPPAPRSRAAPQDGPANGRPDARRRGDGEVTYDNGRGWW
ncbi:MAG TPA: DEAD/DEAH box helicase [Candidatus Thermoplasmatota archaeon]|jgi:superfamily II DNA/RNA helicase|nr:DEAD/DEAH box helicase [Candidatus Thermoplasmatota archaeon]